MSTLASEELSMTSLDSELYFLISRFLDLGPCRKAAEVLRGEIEHHQLLPKRIDWRGKEHAQSFQNLLDVNKHIPPDHLERICQRIGPLLDKEVKPSVLGVRSLLGSGRQSLLRTQEGSKYTKWPVRTHTVVQHGQLKLPPSNLQPLPNLAQTITCRQLTGLVNYTHAVQCKNIYSKISMLSRTLGHLSAVYCVTFDRSGRYIFTGADDHLVKVWSSMDGRLLATLRGHSAEITDMAVNHENTMLASGGCDKVVRVWCLKTCGPVAVLTGHTGVITSVQFCPLVRGDDRWLVSTGGDGCVCFWHWNATTRTFDHKPLKFLERSRAGAQMLCSSFSAGGVFLATGSTDHVIRVYCFLSSAAEKICELEAHTDRVDSIAYSNKGDRFLSGSKDGTARIWRYNRQEWKAIILNMNTKLKNSNESALPSDMRPPKPKVTMVGWSTNDSYVVTAVSDYTIKVWNATNGNLLHSLEGHEDEVYVLDPNPVDERIMLSASHDGNIIIWDIEKGVLIKSFFNMIEGQGHGSIFDCKFSHNGQSIVATDSHGHILIFGFGSSQQFEKVPKENFFHTDYRPLMRDSNNYVLDEQTQQPPHLMPPPFLVDVDGNPHPPAYQRLVPGREKCSLENLVPQMVDTASGDREVADIQVPQPPALEVEPPRNLDEAIERMQHLQDNRIQNDGDEPAPPELQSPEPLRSPGPARRSRSESVQSPSHIRVGMRWNGEVEGVRQSAVNIVSQTATNIELKAKKLRRVVGDMDALEFRKNQDWRLGMAEEEVKCFFAEKKKRPLDFMEQDSDSGSYIATRKRTSKKINHNYRTRATRNDPEQTTRNRLATRALYDTEDEEEDLSGDSSVELSDLEPWNNNGNDESDSSEFSDWAADAGMNLQPPKRSSRVPKRKVPHSPGEGSAESSRPRKQQPNRNKQKKQLMNNQHTITELPEEFRPPEWLTDIIPRKTPYVPQMGDEVIYFLQGHQAYVQAVTTRNVYDINPNKNQPWHKLTNLREQELVKVIGIKYEIRPPRLCCLKLGFIDPETGKLTGSYFSIKYHDMPDVIDFLVLRQNYDLAMQRNWKPGDRFRSMIDDAWWIGKIDSQEPFQEIYPDSMYQCFNVQWDNGEKEKLSPWDMEPIVSRRVPKEPGGSVPVSQDELKSLMYSPTETEWPNGDRDSECQRIIHCIEQLMEYRIAEPFLTPVDLTSFPIYAMVIEYPIDLSTIKGRLENNFYRRVTALQFDIRHISSNTETFNQANAPIVKWAHIITDVLLRFICEPELTDVHQAYVDATDGIDGVDNDDEEDEDNPSTSSRRKGGSKKSSSSDPNAWKKQCEQLLTTVLECDDSVPFRSPVDQIDFPDYHEVIDSPMDLSSIKEEFDTGNYRSPHEFAKDMQLIFANSRMYNTNKRSRIYTMTLRLKALFDDQMRGILDDYKRSRKSSSRSKQKQSRSVRESSISSTVTYPSTSRRRPPRPQFRAEAVSSPSKSRTQQNTSRSTRNQGQSSGSLRLTLRNVPKRKHQSSAESSGEEDEGYRVRRSNRSKVNPSTSNGLGNYTTRHRTGAIKRRRYDEYGVTTADDDDDGDDSDGNDDVDVEDEDYDERETKPTLSRKRAVPMTNGHSSSVSRPRRAATMKPMALSELSDEEEKPGVKIVDDDDDEEDGGDSQTNSSESSDSDATEENSENDDDDNDDSVRRSRRTTTRNSTKATQSVQSRAGGRRAVKRNTYGDDFEEESTQIRTRNRGQKTVQYAEGSDDEEEVHSGRKGTGSRRGAKKIQYKEEEDDDDDEKTEEEGDDDEEEVHSGRKGTGSRRGAKKIQYKEEEDDDDDEKTEEEDNDDDEKTEEENDDDEYSDKPVRSSRRAGKRVQYAEDSNDDDEDDDGDYKPVSRSKRRRRVTCSDDEDDEDDDAADEAVVSMSSRGRIRRMTSRARESLLGV